MAALNDMSGLLESLQLGITEDVLNVNTPNDFPAPHVILPEGEHILTVILLHGRGTDGEEFQEELFETIFDANQPIPKSLYENIKWVFPTTRPGYSTVFQGEMTKWFDIYSLMDPEAEQERQKTGLGESVRCARGVVVREVEVLGGEATRVILGGISMGCAVATHVLLILVSLGSTVLASHQMQRSVASLGGAVGCHSASE
jgi:predicted esterase